MTEDPRGFGIYIHWPFCKAKCPYCDFNSHVRERIEEEVWRDSYRKELAHYAAMVPGRTVSSIFFGGGTPSLMNPATAEAVIDAVARHWRVANDIEVTLEANPTSVEAEKLRDFRRAGINRVSLGIQALDDADLKFLGRQHNQSEGLNALALAANTFERFTFDLIYARPGQTIEKWRAELRRALGFAADHISLYQLTIETGTVFEQAYARGDFVLPEEDVQAELYEMTAAILGDAGMADYEISNYAKPGSESRHNLTYWRYGDYVGIGPGAHGRLTIGGSKFATRQHRAPERWLEMVADGGHATRQHERVDVAARISELTMMGLRLAEGIPLARFEAEAGRPFADCLDGAALRRLGEGGFLEVQEGRLIATAAGRQRLDAVLGDLLG
ncbi:radical SAM family heme chaperone HemW [Dongia rigui]|uniref:Heme chaperone HemW n=1 Tax=Dongia rigui TaxID=940149 RepID=A0ABU5DX33_9PROT|nr:radical SAM family heme chaperone HemW [Dongia rigui]MDY0871839.1 radical SAM family heme chaperone HemW [Dongia rigui]